VWCVYENQLNAGDVIFTSVVTSRLSTGNVRQKGEKKNRENVSINIMALNKKTIDKVDVKGKRVLMR